MAEVTREELLARYAAGERDFSRLNLSGMVFGGCVLDGCNFRGANFSYADFSNWTHIMDCDFRDTTFFKANLSHCAFSGSNFTGADMREVTFEWGEGIGVIFENVDFRGCGAIGKFVHEGTLCLRNCIGQDGRIIELFNEETVLRELSRRNQKLIRRMSKRGSVEKGTAISHNSINKSVNLTAGQSIDVDFIPF